MGEKFLRNVAIDFAAMGKERVLSTTFIFPNRRSSLFFKKYLSQSMPGAFFAPRIFTVSDFFSYLHDVPIANKLTLLVVLWREWKEMGLSDTLDDFLFWGDIILSDFSDVDFYMVDAKQLFINTKDYKEITTDFSWMSAEQRKAVERISGIRNFWEKYSTSTIDSDEKDSFHKIFLKQWNTLYPLYCSYKKALSDKNLSYSAMLYRTVAEAVLQRRKNLELNEEQLKIVAKLDSIGKIAFIGFSAPTNCEKELMRYFKGEDKGLFYWDFFSEWIKDSENKSSFLIKSCVDEFGNDYHYEERFSKDELKIKVYPVVGSSEQTILASKILSEEIYKNDNNGLDSAVVVSDEKLLVPFLNTLPECYPDINITMGFPVAFTSLYSFLKALFRLVGTVAPPKAGVRDEYSFQSSRLLEFLSSEYFADNHAVHKFVLRKRNDNSFYLSFSELNDFEWLKLPPLLYDKELRSQIAGTSQLMDATIDFYLNILGNIENYLNKFEKGVLYAIVDTLNELRSLGIEVERMSTVNSIINSALKALSLTFKGEPLAGLQIMGPLETRLLDFDNIVFLSFNENVFPKSGEQSSAIPYFLRKSFGLPTYEYKDSISAYNFYRLTQRAKNIYCIYDTNNNQNSGGAKEESRFLKQLRYAYSANIERISVDFNYIGESLSKGEGMKKDVGVLKGKRFSASALNKYFMCPLQFYLQGILKLEEEKDIEEGIDSSGFGTVFHYCMKEIYSPYAGKLVGSKEIAEIKSKFFSSDPTNLEKLVSDAFLKELGLRYIDGENIIVKELVKKYVASTIRRDGERIRDAGAFRYLVGEDKEMFADLYLINESGVRFGFYGVIDRVEILPNGRVLLIDYKTGKLKEIKSEVKGHLESEESFEFALDKIFDYSGKREPVFGYIFQILLYALMYSNLDDSKKDLEVGLYQIQDIKGSGLYSFAVSSSKLKKFSLRLFDMMERIYSDSDKYWSRNVGCKGCEYCNFSSYCLRNLNVIINEE